MSSATLEQTLLSMLAGDSNSLIAIAVGCAEGTRTKDGGKTAAWSGHTDSGNGARNQGSFSYQGEASSPEAADKLQIEKLKTVLLPRFLAIAQRAGWLEKKSKILFAVACDLFTQSEAACLAESGFLDQIFSHREFVVDQQWLIEWRCKAYINLATKRLDAPGFGNNIGRLRVDQSRRTLAALGAIA